MRINSVLQIAPAHSPLRLAILRPATCDLRPATGIPVLSSLQFVLYYFLWMVESETRSPVRSAWRSFLPYWPTSTMLSDGLRPRYFCSFSRS